MAFSFSAALNNLVGNTPGANVSNLVQCLNDLKTYINGSIDSTNLLDGGVTEAKLAVAARIPVGTILMTGGSTADTGFLLCDGAAVSRATYADLFTRISTGFGAGNGTTTFNVPDGLGRAPVGAGTGSGLSAKTLGAKVGSEPSNMPSHTHAPLAGAGAWLTDVGTAYAAGVAGADFGVNFQGATSAGSGSATDGNVPPSFVVKYQIKY